MSTFLYISINKHDSLEFFLDFFLRQSILLTFWYPPEKNLHFGFWAPKKLTFWYFDKSDQKLTFSYPSRNLKQKTYIFVGNHWHIITPNEFHFNSYVIET